MIDRYVDLARARGPSPDPAGPATTSGGHRSGPLRRSASSTLVMFGRGGSRDTARRRREVPARQLPGATLILYPGVGHLPMEQIPEQSAADLKAWLAAHPAK
ncbi:alpha/beta fold hydrolase [Caulobacter segnis]